MGPSAGGEPSVNQHPSGERSQSEVVGVILILGIVMAGSFAILALGATAIGDTEQKLSGDRAEKTLTQFDSKAGLVALGESNSQKISLPSRGNEDFSVNESKGTLTIQITNRTSGTVSWGNPLIEVDLGVMEFENDGTKLAYQGGGVFRAGERNGTMVSPPEFHYRNGTLTLPIVNITGGGSLGPAATVSHSDENRTFPLTESINHTNPLDNHEVKLTVKSEYYEGWGQYFEERTDGEVRYDHDAEEVTLKLVSPVGDETLNAGIRSLGAGGTFSVRGSSGDPCGGGSGDRYVSSYNSSGTTDNYCDQKAAGTIGQNGNITYGGDIDFSGGSGQSDVEGTLRSGGKVELSGGGGQPAVTGNVYHDDGCQVTTGGGSDCESETGGTVEKFSSAPQPSPDISDNIENTVSTTNESGNNDNDEAGIPIDSNDNLDYGADNTATLESGTYYLERIDFSGGDTLELDTSGGDILLAVEEFIEVGSSDEIAISGGNKVKIYVNATSTIPGPSGPNNNMLVVDGGVVSVEHDNSTELRVYGKPNADVTIDDGQFTGVIYAPPGNTGTGKLYLDHGHLFGGAVIADTELETQSSLHYDEALAEEQIIDEGTNVVKITYLHITENEIEID